MATFNIETPDGVVHNVNIAEGRSILDACRQAKLPLDGLCGGELACSTCHVQIMPPWIDRIPSASADEEDMLDLLPNTVEGSRLGCQIKAAQDTDGLYARIIASTGDNA